MLNTIIEVDGAEYDLFKDFNFITRRVQIGKVTSKDEEVNVPYRNGSLIVRASSQPVFENRNIQIHLIHVGSAPHEDSSKLENLVLGKKCKVYIGKPSEIDKMATDRYYWKGYIEAGELKSSDIRWYKSITVNAYPYRMAADTELLYNGDGSKGKDGWTKIIFTEGDAPTGCKGYFKADSTLAVSQAMAYDPDGIYKISGWHRVDAANDLAVTHFGLKPLDIDNKTILPWNVKKITDPVFTLAKELKKGDTKIYLNEDVSNWKTTDININWQAVAIFDYKDSKGNSYDNYTRHYYTHVYDADGINTSDNSITLRSAWTGDTYAEGTKVARTLDGSTYVYSLNDTKKNKDWKRFEKYMIATKNNTALMGLAYAARVQIVPEATTPQSNWAGLSLKKLPGKNVTIDTSATVTIKNEGTINIIPTFIGIDTAKVTVSDGTNSYSFSGEGEHKSANIFLEAGKSTTLTLTATSFTNVGITWREGRF